MTTAASHRLPLLHLTTALLLTLGLAGCDGTRGSDDGGAEEDAGIETGDGCRSDADCMSEDAPFVECYAPGRRVEGDAPHPEPERLCEASDECAGDTVCTPYRNAYGDTNTDCRPPCSADSCEEGDRCGAEGLCEPIPCDEGYACATHTTCDPSAAGHGCVRDTCDADDDCDGGFCVIGRCYSRAGMCVVQW